MELKEQTAKSRKRKPEIGPIIDPTKVGSASGCYITNFLLIQFEYISHETKDTILGRDLIKRKAKMVEQIGARYTKREVFYFSQVPAELSDIFSVKPDEHLIKKFLAYHTIQRLGTQRGFYKRDMPPQKIELLYPDWKMKFLQTVKLIITTEGKLCKKGFSGESRKVCEVCLAFKDIEHHRDRKVQFRTVPTYPPGTFKLKCECLFCHKKKTELGLVRPVSYFQFHKTLVTHPTDLSIANKFKICFEARRWNAETNVHRYRKLTNGCWIADWKYFWQQFNDQDPEYGEVIKWREDFLNSQTLFPKETFFTVRYDEEL